MGFLSKLFGLDKKEKTKPEVAAIEHSGYQIYPEPIARSGQFQINGRICKTMGNGETLTHEFIRSDLLMTSEDAAEIMVTKSRRFIDQMGDEIFS